jgi:hypothetical protein
MYMRIPVVYSEAKQEPKTISLPCYVTKATKPQTVTTYVALDDELVQRATELTGATGVD